MTLFATLDCITSPRWGRGCCSCHDHWPWSFIHPYLKLYIWPTPQESSGQLLDLQPCLPDATIQPLSSFQMKLSQLPVHLYTHTDIYLLISFVRHSVIHNRSLFTAFSCRDSRYHVCLSLLGRPNNGRRTKSADNPRAHSCTQPVTSRSPARNVSRSTLCSEK